MKRAPRTLRLSTLISLAACEESREWARTLPASTTPEAAYLACLRGDWMVWLLGALHKRGAVTRQVLVLAGCSAARTALPHMKGRPAEAASLAAIETTERWCRGEATTEDVIAARVACAKARQQAWEEYVRTRAAADADAYDAAAYDAAAYAAAADAADAAAYAAVLAAAADAARAQRRAEVADAVRAVVQWATAEAALAKLAE